MLAVDKFMYHFHPHNGYDDYWEEGNEIIVDKGFNMPRQFFIKSFSTGVYCVNPDGIRPLSDVINIISNFIDTDEKLLELKDYDKELYLKNMKQIVSILKDSSNIIEYASIYNLESSLENVRKKYYDYLPSRLNSLFCVHENDINTWIDNYKNIDYDLYEVALTGNLFRTNRDLIPKLGLTTYETELNAHAYWHPTIKGLNQSGFREYLFNGKAKVLRKVDKKEFE